MKSIIANAIVAGLMLSGAAVAETIYVAQDGSGDYGTVQEAIADVSNDGSYQDDVIVVRQGTYAGGWGFPYQAGISHFVTIISEDGPSVTFIDTSATSNGLIAQANPPIVISGFSIGGSGTVVNLLGNWYVNFVNCRFDQGGYVAIQCTDGTATLEDCIIEDYTFGLIQYGNGSTTVVGSAFLNCDIPLTYPTTNCSDTLFCGGNDPTDDWWFNDIGGSVYTESCDCNDDSEVDYYTLMSDSSLDCNSNLLIDACEIVDGLVADCNYDLIPDSCNIESGTSNDWDGNAIPDECECLADISGNAIVDIQDVLLVIALWGNVGGDADINIDGFVNVNDLLYIVNMWGSCP